MGSGNKKTALELLIENSPKFNALKKECVAATKSSFTGITNLVVNYENPVLVDLFLKFCFNRTELYRGAYDIDAVELQKGRPGSSLAATYIDELIFGTFAKEKSKEGGMVPSIDPVNGERKRNPDGFTFRKEVATNSCLDRFLIIRNIDQCMDFCQDEPGYIDARALCIFDKFRDSSLRKFCHLLLVTNEPIVFPFDVRVVNMGAIDSFEGQSLLENISSFYTSKGCSVVLSENQKEGILRKLCGLTYSSACDLLMDSFYKSMDIDKSIKGDAVVKILRTKINQKFMEKSVGLTHLNARPWTDYICPKSSNFTYDVKKIVRDFNELDNLKKQLSTDISDDVKQHISHNIEAIRTRMPHVIALYGKGGVGKSAFPVHFAGLLEFDVWDFNINSTHSKWVGEGSKQMRESLDKVLKSSHLVVRIDEYDRAIGSTDGGGQGMHSAHKQVESEFMNWLQNCQDENLLVKNDIFIVLTTNHKENITGPLLRSGRVDLVIDIAEFDSHSIKEAFLTAPTRIRNRGISITGFKNLKDFEKSLQMLDLDTIANLAAKKGFTVRDVDTLLQEMAAHDYYYHKYQEGIAWSNDNFIRVLENSEGCTKGTNTSELKLGDRHLISQEHLVPDQSEFGFVNLYSPDFDMDHIIEKHKMI